MGGGNFTKKKNPKFGRAIFYGNSLKGDLEHKLIFQKGKKNPLFQTPPKPPKGKKTIFFVFPNFLGPLISFWKIPKFFKVFFPKNKRFPQKKKKKKNANCRLFVKPKKNPKRGKKRVFGKGKKIFFQ